MDDAGTPVPVERPKLEIARLSDELRKSLQDSIYLRMSAREYRAYEEKCQEIKRLTQELAQLIQVPRHPPATISPPAASPVLPPLGPLKPPKNEA